MKILVDSLDIINTPILKLHGTHFLFLDFTLNKTVIDEVFDIIEYFQNLVIVDLSYNDLYDNGIATFLEKLQKGKISPINTLRIKSIR